MPPDMMAFKLVYDKSKVLFELLSDMCHYIVNGFSTLFIVRVNLITRQ